MDLNKKYYRGVGKECHEIPPATELIAEIVASPCYRDYNKYMNFCASSVECAGLWMEFGVWKGKTIVLLAESTSETIYGFDSFEGLPESWYDDKGCFSLGGTPPELNIDNIKLVKGWYNETLQPFLEKHNEKVAFVHIDCDLYSSTKCVFDNIADRVQVGTIIIFDELWHCWKWEEHEYKAWEEFLEERNVKVTCIAHNDGSKAAFRIDSIG